MRALLICLCILEVILHGALLGAPLWFFCAMGSGESRTTLVFGLFYKTVGEPEPGYEPGSYYYGKDDITSESVDFFPQTDSSEFKAMSGSGKASAIFYFIVKLQVIFSAALLVLSFCWVCSDRGLDSKPARSVWFIFLLNRFFSGLIAFITQFLGFLGHSLKDCQTFLGAYLSMTLALVYMCVYKISEKSRRNGGEGNRFVLSNTTSVADTSVQMARLVTNISGIQRGGATEATHWGNTGIHPRNNIRMKQTVQPNPLGPSTDTGTVHWSQQGNIACAQAYSQGQNASEQTEPAVPSGAIRGEDSSSQVAHTTSHTTTEPPPGYFI
eukprot:gb/GECG01009023.1/.p1 GENE.gb/GECG01009023.1/~~gb/GECG01009023.1/.p1  ORF type:complete len:326 (+),score=12.82 gb/GECG01009023.1/:1-978(+)